MELLHMKQREFVYMGDPLPVIDERENAAFFLNFKKSIIISLEQRQLLTPSQREQCFIALENQYSQKSKH